MSDTLLTKAELRAAADDFAFALFSSDGEAPARVLADAALLSLRRELDRMKSAAVQRYQWRSFAHG